MYERADEIGNAGGYLRSLTERARAGQFSPWPMVMALLRKKMKESSSADAGANVRSFQAGSAEKGDHDETHFEASDALRRSIAKKQWDR
nr:replication initiation protein RepC [Tianweitania populi]